MASNKKVIHLGMDYSEFTGGVTEINRKMTLLDEQFKLSNEEVKAFGDETNQLSLKHELLTQKINLVSQKVEESRDKYEKAKASGEKSEKQLDNLQKEYIKNQTSLQKLNNELSDNKEKLDKASKGYTSFGDSILNMSSFLGVNVSPALQTVANKFDGMHKSVGNAILGIGAIAATFVSFTLSAADTADELLRLSSVTGITTDELQKLQYASDFLDVDVEVMTGGITKLTRNMNNARNGSKELDEAFDKLHVRYKDGNNVLLDSNEVFYRTIDALGKVKNETERDALSMTLLGKSAKELNPLIEAGSKKLKDLGVEAENMGAVMDQNSLDKLGKLKDAMDKFKNTTGALKNSLALALLPVLTKVFEAIAKIPVPVLQTLVILATVIATVLMIVKAIKSVTDTADTIHKFMDAANAKTLKTVGIVLAVVAALIALGAIIAVIIGRGEELNSAMDSIGTSVGKVTETVNTTPQRTVNAIGHANGTANFEGGDTWINEGGPEVVRLPKGSRIFSNSESKEMFGGNTYINITVPLDSLKQITNFMTWAEGEKQRYRQGGVRIG